jgi:hypothetical protein
MVQESEELVRDIKFLINLRKEAGIKASSHIRILAAEKDIYVADITGDRNIIRCKLGPQENMGRWSPRDSDGWELKLSDKGNVQLWSRPVAVDGMRAHQPRSITCV